MTYGAPSSLRKQQRRETGAEATGPFNRPQCRAVQSAERGRRVPPHAPARRLYESARGPHDLDPRLPLPRDRDEFGCAPKLECSRCRPNGARSISRGHEYETPRVGVSDPADASTAVNVRDLEHVADLKIVGRDESTAHDIDRPDDAHPSAWRPRVGPHVTDRGDVQSPRRVQHAAVCTDAAERRRVRNWQNELDRHLRWAGRATATPGSHDDIVCRKNGSIVGTVTRRLQPTQIPLEGAVGGGCAEGIRARPRGRPSERRGNGSGQ
jgi:hypothetical protein